jgi:hypothetical protein
VAKVSDAYHAAVTYAVRTVKAVARTAVSLARTAVHVVATAHHLGSAAMALLKQAAGATSKAVASFVKKHAAIAADALAVGPGAIGREAVNAASGMAQSAITQVADKIGLLGGKLWYTIGGKSWVEQWRAGWDNKPVAWSQNGKLNVAMPSGDMIQFGGIKETRPGGTWGKWPLRPG